MKDVTMTIRHSIYLTAEAIIIGMAIWIASDALGIHIEKGLSNIKVNVIVNANGEKAK